MLQFNLQSEQRDLLVIILEEYLRDLRGEIGDTANFDYRQSLKEEEKELCEILYILSQAYECSPLTLQA